MNRPVRVLILFSSFPNDAALPLRPKVTTMSDQIIVIGFDDPPPSFLARTALARLQKELGLQSNDLATVNLGMRPRFAR
jgi:hypothetical protein